jgi:hypothetical protein
MKSFQFLYIITTQATIDSEVIICDLMYKGGLYEYFQAVL